MTARRYEPRGPQAIEPQALYSVFDIFLDGTSDNTTNDEATIITIRGPLSQHGYWWDSYESIRRRVDEACSQAAPVVVLRIDSPGGEVAGLFDCARAIRGACSEAGKRLVVHIEGQCSSAAYALACTADRIVASTTADVGSIGIIACRLDETVRDAKEGFKVALITSGARKADWNPHAPVTDEELAAHQVEVDGLAAEFFALVSTYRKGLSAAGVEALQAGSFRGSAAMKAGLVDELGSFDHVLASLSAAPGGTMSKAEDVRESLRSLAEDEEASDEDRARARRALAAMDDEDAPAKDDDEKPADDKPADDAEGEEDDKEAKKAAKPSPAVSAATAGALAAHGSDVERRLAKLEAQNEAAERKALIAAHGGVTPGLAKLLATKPLAEVRSILAELPKPKRPRLGDAAATATVAGTRGAGQDKASQLPPAEAQAMRLAMGLETEQFGVVEQGNVLMLGAPKPAGVPVAPIAPAKGGE